MLNGTIDPRFNRLLYKKVDKILPGASLTCGYGTEEAVLQISVNRELAAQTVGTDQGDPDIEQKIQFYLDQYADDFKEIEATIRNYLDENVDYMQGWRRVIA